MAANLISTVDFHTHILPETDDGARNIGESLAMLRAEADCGVRTVVLTPHFYPSQDRPESFLRRRGEALRQLTGASFPEGLRIAVGAETAYWSGIGGYADIREFCITGTSLLLVEMPFGPWDGSALQQLTQLLGRGITPVLAHAERYNYKGNFSLMLQLRKAGVMMQVNRSIFDSRSLFARRLLRRGLADFCGSDCHNTHSRPAGLLYPDRYIKKHADRAEAFSARFNENAREAGL